MMRQRHFVVPAMRTEVVSTVPAMMVHAVPVHRQPPFELGVGTEVRQRIVLSVCHPRNDEGGDMKGPSGEHG
jgi:hypothetical protein